MKLRTKREETHDENIHHPMLAAALLIAGQQNKLSNEIYRD
jgi:hypothetical protein